MSAHPIKPTGMCVLLACACAASLLTACGGNSNEGGSGVTINLGGGVAGDGYGTGGSAGALQILKQTGGGDVLVRTSGVANAEFTILSAPTADLGAVPLLVSADTDLSATLLADCLETPPAVAGTPYMVAGQFSIFIADGLSLACVAPVATGLRVDAGATLTLGLNDGSQGHVQFANDVDNRGTITVVDIAPTDRGSLMLQQDNYFGSGKLLTVGTQPGQNGGAIYLSAGTGLLNSGLVDASGADNAGGSGGAGGANIHLEGFYYTQNTGELRLNGGAGSNGSGGSTGYVELYTDAGPLLNAGNISTQGGTGLYGGGNGGDIRFDHDGLGKSFNSGTLQAGGGAATANGYGGNGGHVSLYGYGDEVRNSGAVYADGGMAAGAWGWGGGAGSLDVGSYNADCALYAAAPAGDITWSGAISIRGGDAVINGHGSGGAGGSVNVFAGNDYTCMPFATAASTIEFLGYGKLQLNGGSGDQGGNGNTLALYNYHGDVDSGGAPLAIPAGNILLDVPYEGRGGDAVPAGQLANGAGGTGAPGVDIATDTPDFAGTTGQQVHIGAGWDIRGGANRNALAGSAGAGGSARIYGAAGVTMDVGVRADGGSDVASDGGTDGAGGNGGTIQMLSDAGKVQGATVSAAGGAGEFAGGNGGVLAVIGTDVRFDAAYVPGGDASATLTGAIGGSGGAIMLDGTHSSSISSVDFRGGTGGADGNAGYFWANNCAGPAC